MDKVEFLLKFQDGKISNGQACAMLGNPKMAPSESAVVTTGTLKQPIKIRFHSKYCLSELIQA